MESVQITLRNYRPFTQEHPARFEIGQGITAFVGQNNAGKTAILRFLYEYADLFEKLGTSRAMWAAKTDQVLTFTLRGRQGDEPFSFQNDSPMLIDVRIVIDKIVVEISLRIERQTANQVHFDSFKLNGTELRGMEVSATISDSSLKIGHPFNLELSPFCESLRELSNVLLIPSARTLTSAPIGENNARRSDAAIPLLTTWKAIKGSDERRLRRIAVEIAENNKGPLRIH